MKTQSLKSLKELKLIVLQDEALLQIKGGDGSSGSSQTGSSEADEPDR